MEFKQEIARGLLSIEAVFLRPEEPFTWASGIKSPIYCDNRLTLTAPDVRTMIENGLVQLIRANYPDCEVLMGTSTAGIAHAAIVGHLMDLPMGYVRGSAKDHGRTNQIEGKLIPGQKVVVVEDLISTAGSAVDTVKVLREAGAEVPPAGNCAQTILRVYAAELGLSEEQAAAIAANFGGGMKRGSVCGAVTAALMVLGAAGITDAASVQQFQTAFAQKHDGMLCCADLLKANMEKGGNKKAHCDGLILESIELIDKLMEAEGK